jgi:hypothetical protein
VTIADEHLGELVRLIRGADSVELKLSVPESQQRSTIAALEMDPLDAEIRQVYFFDTPELALNEAGVVVRARRVQGRGDDSVVKLRPVVPGELPVKLRIAPGFGVEVDAMPGAFVCSASLKSVLGPGAVKDAAAGDRALHKLFSKDQRALFATYAPPGVVLDDLAILGPVFVLKLKFRPAELDRRLVAELWLYPDDSRILELSTKCRPADAFQAAAEVRAYLAEHGVAVCAEQQTKTRRALEFFSRRLAAA